MNWNYLQDSKKPLSDVYAESGFCDITNLSLLIEFTVILGFFGIFCRIIKMRGSFKQIIYYKATRLP